MWREFCDNYIIDLKWIDGWNGYGRIGWRWNSCIVKFI